MLGAIERAATDDQIKGIYLRIDPLTPVSLSTLGEIREALIAFKSSGKPIYAYANDYSQSSYLIASVADRVVLNPKGGFKWQGFSSQVLFYKGLLDKLGIQPEVIRHGTFKAAVEPFLTTQMSPENREQTELLLGTMWEYVVGQIAQSRALSEVDLQHYASALSVVTAEDALRFSLVDALSYEGEVDAQWAELLGEENPNYLSLSSYQATGTLYGESSSSKNRIEVIYAEGEIEGLSSADQMVRASTLMAQLREAREQEQVKAVVLRINSPGGSAIASESICEEVELLRAVKPVIVSMGEMAASGGYYIAAPADVILLNPTTMTGSIGVFSILFNAQKGLANKLGITSDVVKTNPSADMGQPLRPLTTSERNYFQAQVEEVYTTFVERVAEGRNLTTAQVERVAEGRVWSGVSAVEIGLADDFGGLHKAISLAIERAGVKGDYRITSPNAPKDRFTQAIELLGLEVRSQLTPSLSIADKSLRQVVEQYKAVQALQGDGSVQAKMLYDLDIR